MSQNECSFLMLDGGRCRRSVVVDISMFDAVMGWTAISQLCRSHWQSRAKAAALAAGYTWTERETAPISVIAHGGHHL